MYWEKVKQDVREIIKTLCEYKRSRLPLGLLFALTMYTCIGTTQIQYLNFMGYLKGECVDGF